MTDNDSKVYLPYFNELVDQYNNNYHHSVNKKLIDADYSALTEIIETNPKACKLESELLSMKIFLAKITLKIGQEKYLLLILFWKLIFGLIKLQI